MPSDSKKKRDQKKKDAAKKRDVKKSAMTTDGDPTDKPTDAEVEQCNGATDEGCHAVIMVVMVIVLLVVVVLVVVLVIRLKG